MEGDGKERVYNGRADGKMARRGKGYFPGNPVAGRQVGGASFGDTAAYAKLIAEPRRNPTD